MSCGGSFRSSLHGRFHSSLKFRLHFFRFRIAGAEQCEISWSYAIGMSTKYKPVTFTIHQFYVCCIAYTTLLNEWPGILDTMPNLPLRLENHPSKSHIWLHFLCISSKTLAGDGGGSLTWKNEETETFLDFACFWERGWTEEVKWHWKRGG